MSPLLQVIARLVVNQINGYLVTPIDDLGVQYSVQYGTEPICELKFTDRGVIIIVPPDSHTLLPYALDGFEQQLGLALDRIYWG